MEEKTFYQHFDEKFSKKKRKAMVPISHIDTFYARKADGTIQQSQDEDILYHTL
jgi:hypothetical protein